MTAETDLFDDVARKVVDLANETAEQDAEADPWDIADGVLSGAIHFWLHSRQPCSDVSCEDCAVVSTSRLRMIELERLVKAFSEESIYYHSTTDHDVAHA